MAWALLDKTNDITIDILCFRAYLIIEIGSVKGRFEHIGLRNPQVLENVLLYLGSSCSGKGYDRDSFAQAIDNCLDISVLRAKVMPPFGNTVCLIYSYEGDIDRSEKISVLVLGQGFRGYKQQFGIPIANILHNGTYFPLGKGGVQYMGNFISA